MSVAQRRLLRVASSLGVGTALCLLAFGAWLHQRRQHSVQFVDTRARLMRILSERAAQAPIRPAATFGAPWRELAREPIGEELAATFYPALARDRGRENPRKVFCPQAFFVNAPGFNAPIHWDEHPAKVWNVRYVTGSFRNPREPRDPPPRLRVILCGDSHLEGVVPYRETAGAVLERALGALDAPESVEVLNGSSGGYDFYNYLGFLERSLPLEPDVFVAVVYGGNDFLGILPIHAYFERVLLEFPGRAAGESLRNLASRNQGAVSQGFQQLMRFVESPRSAELALDGAVRATLALRAVAQASGVALLVAYLPPMHDVRPQDMREDIEALLAILGYGPEALTTTDRLAERWMEAVAAEGIAVVDLRPALRASDRRAYWRSDHHLDTHGHELVARELLPHLVPYLERTR